MSEEPGLAQSSARDCCSWSLISRSFRISIAFPILLLASFGAVLTPFGWWLSAGIFVGKADDYISDQNDKVEKLRLELDKPGQDAGEVKELQQEMKRAQQELENRIKLQPIITRNKRLPSERPTGDNPVDGSDIFPQPEAKGETPFASLIGAVAKNSNSFPGLTYHRFVAPFQNLFQINMD